MQNGLLTVRVAKPQSVPDKVCKIPGRVATNNRPDTAAPTDSRSAERANRAVQSGAVNRHVAAGARDSLIVFLYLRYYFY
jgi:hypothetical protein